LFFSFIFFFFVWVDFLFTGTAVSSASSAFLEDALEG